MGATCYPYMSIQLMLEILLKEAETKLANTRYINILNLTCTCKSMWNTRVLFFWCVEDLLVLFHLKKKSGFFHQVRGLVMSMKAGRYVGLVEKSQGGWPPVGCFLEKTPFFHGIFMDILTYQRFFFFFRGNSEPTVVVNCNWNSKVTWKNPIWEY